MINNLDKNTNIENTTRNGYNIRVTQRTKELADKIQEKISLETGANKPVSAIIGEMVYQKAEELGVADRDV